MTQHCGTIVAQLVRPIQEPHAASRTAFDRPRRRDHRIRGRRRHRHQGAGRPGREGAPDGGRPDGQHGRLQDAAAAARASGIAAPARRRSSTPPARARRSTSTPASPPTSPTSRTPWRRAASSAGSARASSAAAPTTTRASSCATPTTTSSRTIMKGIGCDWPIGYAGHRAVLRQGGAADRRHRPGRGHPQRAGRHLPDARAVQAARTSGLQGLREAGHQARQARARR